MTLLPRSLLWRTFVIVALAMFTAIGAGIGILQLYEREPRAQIVARQIAAIVNLTRVALLSSRPEARSFLMREIANTERVEIYPAEPGETIQPWPSTALAQRVAQLVTLELTRDRAGGAPRFAIARNGIAGLWVSFGIDEDEYWVRMERERIEQAFPWDWVLWGLIGVLFTLAGTWLVLLRLTQPLRALAAAATEIGRGNIPAPLPDHGTRELTGVAQAFNQMARDLKAQESNRALVLAGISHDLRTPLARLRLGVEMSSDATFRDGMVADIEQMDEVIGQFLEFARAGKDESRPGEAINLSVLAADLVAHYSSLGHDVHIVHMAGDTAGSSEGDSGSNPKGATGAASIPPLQVTALARPAPLKRAAMNLVDNALRYARDAHSAPVIEIGVAQTNGQARIEIRDRGPGIPPSQVERVKQPFTRLDEARGSNDGTVDSAQGGSGLGLAIVDRIVRQCDGKFELLPREGGGLIARISLPRAPT